VTFQSNEDKTRRWPLLNKNQSLQSHWWALLENTPDLIAEFDRDMRLLMCNTAYRHVVQGLCGCDPEAGMTLESMTTPLLYVTIREDFVQVLAGERFCKEYAYPGVNGESSQMYEISYSPVLKDGEVVGVSQLARNITPYKHAEEALKESELRFRNLFENTPDAVFVESLAGNVLDVNPAACLLHGMPAETLIGKNILELVPPIHRDGIRHNFPDMVIGKLRLLESYSLAANGQAIPVEISVSHIEYRGEPALLLQMRDISARKKAEAIQARRAQELSMLNRAIQALNSTLDQDQILSIVLEEVRRLLNVFASSIWLIDETTNELVCRQATGPQSQMVLGWRLQSGQGVAGWVAQTGQSLLIPDTMSDKRHFRGVAQRIQQDLRSLITVPLKAKQKVIGVLQVVDQQVNRFGSSDLTLLEPLGIAAAIAIENARLVENLEKEVAERTAEIAAERDKSEAILHSVGDAIAMVNTALQVHYINPAFEKLTGYTVAETWNQPLDTLLGDVGEPVRQGILNGSKNGASWQGEVTIRRKDGRTCEVALTSAPIRDADGVLLGYVVSHQDISRFKELDEARRQFIRNVSHQFRTPVATLKAQAHVMQYTPQSEQNQRYIAMMQEQIVTLTKLIEDIIAMTVLDSGEIVRTWERVSLAELMFTMLDRYSQNAEKTGVTFAMGEEAPPTLCVQGDRGRLLEALGKIVDNALKFTPADGRITLHAGIAWRDERDWATLKVQDTGPGIPADEQDRVFERFFQGRLAESGHMPGTGLGLSFAWEVLRAHGGHITLESPEGKGLAVTLWLPLAPES